jgi:hypothetical protein
MAGAALAAEERRAEALAARAQATGDAAAAVRAVQLGADGRRDGGAALSRAAQLDLPPHRRFTAAIRAMDRADRASLAADAALRRSLGVPVR